jgi:predicted Holliday junction resolvase-like endonuclease
MDVALTIVGCVVSALLTLVIFYLRDIKETINKQNGRHTELQKEISELKATLPREYVRREDWIMSFGKIEQKIDAIWEFVHKFIEREG